MGSATPSEMGSLDVLVIWDWQENGARLVSILLRLYKSEIMIYVLRYDFLSFWSLCTMLPKDLLEIIWKGLSLLSDYEKHLVLFLHFFKDLAHHVLLLFTVLFHLWFGIKIFLKSFVYQSLQGIVCSRLLCLLSFRHRWLCEQRLSEPWDMHGRWGGISLHLQGRLRGEVLSDGP